MSTGEAIYNNTEFDEISSDGEEEEIFYQHRHSFISFYFIFLFSANFVDKVDEPVAFDASEYLRLKI